MNQIHTHSEPSASNNPIITFGWSETWSQTLADHFPLRNPSLNQIGRVISAHRTQWTLITLKGVVHASIAGHFHELDNTERPVVGDWVICNEIQSDSTVIDAIIPRTNLLKRVAPGKHDSDQAVAANVDRVFIVGGLDEDHEPRRLRRYVALVKGCDAEPIVVLNKSDLGTDTETQINELHGIDAPIHCVSVEQQTGLDQLAPYLSPGSTIALLGSSGVGKSTLINALTKSEQRETGAIRSDDSKGRHTTTSRELISHCSGAIIMDTPGMRELALSSDASDLDSSFSDLTALTTECRFNDCSHQGEPGCAVQAAIDQGIISQDHFADYQKLEREQIVNTERKHERNARMKQFGRMVKDAKKRKGRW